MGLYVFILVIISSSFFAFSCQSIDYSGGVKCNKVKLIISFVIALSGIVFCKSGPDYDNYCKIIEISEFDNLLIGTSEIGFNFFCAFLKELFGSKPDIIIAIIKFITLSFVYLSFYKLRNQINIGFSVFCYILFFWLASFYLISLAIASSIMLYAFSIFWVDSHKYLSFALCLIAAQLHTSAYIGLLIYILIYCSCYKPILFLKCRLILLVAALLSTFAINVLVGYFAENFASFHYQEYLDTGNESGIGLKVLVEYLLLYICYRALYKSSVDLEFKNVYFVLLVSTFCVTILGYQINVASRVLYILMAFQVFVFSKIIFLSRIGRIHKKIQSSIYGYIFIEGILKSYAELYGDGNIVDYQFFNPF